MLNVKLVNDTKYKGDKNMSIVGKRIKGRKLLEDIENYAGVANYIIYKDGIYTIAVDGNTGREVIKNTDSHTVIQYCHDIMKDAGRGGIIFLKPAIYRLSDTILIQSRGISLIGSGLDNNGTRFYIDDNVDKDAIKYVAEIGETWYFAQLRNFSIYGNQANQASGSGIRVSESGGGRANDLFISDIFFTDCKEHGLYLKYGWGTHISHILAEYCGVHGLYIKGTQAYISEVFSAHNGGHGILVVGQRTRFSNIDCLGNEINGINVHTNSHELQFTNVYIRESNADDGGDDALVANGENCIYTNLIIYGNAGVPKPVTGIELVDGSDNIFNGFIILNCATNSITLDASSDDNLFLNGKVVQAPSDLGAGNVFKNIKGYATEVGGAAAAIADGGTIAHGCAAEPTYATVDGSVAGEIISLTGKDAANLTVAIKKHDGTAGTAQTIYWRAWV